MPLITVEKANNARAVIDKMIEQGDLLFGDIDETAQELARLWQEAEEHRRIIAERDHTITHLESRLADATARLESISATARIEPAKSNGPDRSADAGSAGLAALERLAAREARP